ncbi:PREDICTED: leucine-rich repeat-containing protein 43 [Condylura cristata]|uniref:leucine-rich repeat-containing protein 43 n=1 Tax=Condylura cristata TaxID=143302 RepID=UPI0006437B22|nr:PREDICTED: leucine-rich repeat-containing protein 43 [Condylura cristata]
MAGWVSKPLRAASPQCVRSTLLGFEAWAWVRAQGGPALHPQNESRFLPPTGRTWRELVPWEAALSPQEEPVGALLDLLRSPQSPWALEEGAHAEDGFLRELAVRRPLAIGEAFFYTYFRSLRVVDKEVDEVDKGLLRFQRLEELVLSANRIREIDAAHLPPTLKVLELYGNQVGSLQGLCARPPPLLQHLGLGHNGLLGTLDSAFLASGHWPNLVSLDLSFNGLTGLQRVLAGLSSLPRLRLLLLQGNPLALVPYYRGLTVDSLARLCVLDDVTVSPGERRQFRGLSRSGELLAPEAQLVVTIGNAVGLPDPSAREPDPGPQGPFVAYSYYVTYDFVEDEGSRGDQYGSVLAEIVQPSPSEQLGDDSGGEPDGSLTSAESPGSEPEESAVLAALPKSTNSAEELAKLRPKIDTRLFPSPGTVLFSTAHKPWSEVLSFGYEMHHTLSALVPLKAFLLSGTTVTMVEEKVFLTAPEGGKAKARLPGTVATPLAPGPAPWLPGLRLGLVAALSALRRVPVSPERRKSWPHAPDFAPQPEALTVEVQFQLTQCRSAEEALRVVTLLGAD